MITDIISSQSVMKLYNLACEDKGLMPSNTCQPIKFKGPYNHLVYVPSLKKKK